MEEGCIERPRSGWWGKPRRGALRAPVNHGRRAHGARPYNGSLPGFRKPEKGFGGFFATTPSCLKALAFTFAFVLAAAMFAFPGAAHAKFNDMTDSFPAAQDLGAYGAPIAGDQLPDGTYKVGARGTSRMCIMYTNPEDAEARDSKEQAIISVEGGNITALFYLSKAYTHIYFGTQEQAAAATNEDGTDASAYIGGDPPEGYVPHLFAISVPALNEPITISTYSGGDHGLEEGKWYTRQFVFTMTEDELAAAIAGGQAEEPQGDSPSDEQAVQEEAQGAGGAGATQSIQGPIGVWSKGSQEGITFTFTRSDGDENTFSLFQDAFVDQQKLPADAYTAREGSLILTLLPAYLETLDVGRHVLEVTFSDGVSTAAEFLVEEKAVEKSEATGGMRGIPLSGVMLDDPSLDDADLQAEAVEPEQPQQEFPLKPLLFAGGVVAAFAVGAGTRTVLFTREYEDGGK